jgi:hypothetical protein
MLVPSTLVVAEALTGRFDRPDRSKRRFASCEKRAVRWTLRGNGLKVRFAEGGGVQFWGGSRWNVGPAGVIGEPSRMQIQRIATSPQTQREGRWREIGLTTLLSLPSPPDQASPAMVPELPQEIIDKIIDDIALDPCTETRRAARTMKKLSLISSKWVHRSRMHLFRIMEFTSDNFSMWCKNVRPGSDGPSRKVAHIRYKAAWVEVERRIGPLEGLARSPSHMSAFTNLQTLHFVEISLTTCQLLDLFRGIGNRRPRVVAGGLSDEYKPIRLVHPALHEPRTLPPHTPPVHGRGQASVSGHGGTTSSKGNTGIPPA